MSTTSTDLSSAESSHRLAVEIEAQVEHLDLATVINISQAVSGELVLEKLIDAIMRTAIEHGGAERGVLVLSRSTESRIAAQGTMCDGRIVVKLHDQPMTPAVVPESLMRHVLCTNESVTLNDAAAQNQFAADAYIRLQHVCSIVCLPLLNRGQPIGALYLENNLTPRAFTPARIAVLKLLASQAAISLQQARLCRDLTEREATIRCLVEAQAPQTGDELRAIIDNAHVFLWSHLPDGYCDFLNQSWLNYFNLSLQEAQGAGWARVLHPDDAAHHLESWQKSVLTGIPFETQARYRRSDGEYRWFLNRAKPRRDKTGRIVKWYGTNIDIENLKRTEARLRQSEAYLAEAQRLSHTGSFGWNLDAGEIIWSDETYRIFEYDYARKPSVDMLVQRVHPEDRALVQELIDRVSKSGADFEHEYRLLLPDGRVKHVHAIAHASQDASGKREFIGAVIDVTERKITEGQLRCRAQELQRSEFYLAEGQRLGHTGSWALNPSGFFEYWSRELFQIYGLDPRRGAPTLEQYLATIHPEDRDFMAETVKGMCALGSGFDVKMRIIRPEGVRYIRCVGIPVFDNGVLKKSLGTAMDITEQEQLTVELQRREGYLAEAQKLSRTGSWAWNPSEDITYWSEECFRVLSFDPQAALPHITEFFQRLHPDDQPGIRELVQTAIREKSDWEGDYRIVHPNGPTRDIHVVAHPVLSASGQLVEFVGTVIDVTEHKRAEQERARLRQMEEELRNTQAEFARVTCVVTMGELTASIAHEVNQPLGAMVTSAASAARWLAAEPPRMDKARRALERIAADGRRAAAIIERIRALLKRETPRKDWLDVNEMILEVITLPQYEMRQNDIVLETRLTADLPRVLGDKVQCQQVLLNLIVNAIEAMNAIKERPRELTIVSASDGPDAVSIEVRDSGTGIDLDHTPHMFEPFYTTKTEGLGIGLSISRSIVEAHGGRLSAAANAPHGTVFSVSLPVNKPVP